MVSGKKILAGYPAKSIFGATINTIQTQKNTNIQDLTNIKNDPK